MKANRQIALSCYALVVALLPSCSGNDGVVKFTAGPFAITRTLHHYNHEGIRTNFGSEVVLYREQPFTFIARPETPDHTHQVQSKHITRAYGIPAQPESILITADNPDDDEPRMFVVLSAAESQPHAIYLSAMNGPQGLTWLDGEDPQPIDLTLQETHLPKGRWLWLENEVLVDLATLKVFRLIARDELEFLAFVMWSPDRTHIARSASVSHCKEYGMDCVIENIILDNDVATGLATEFSIAPFSEERVHPDRDWLMKNFEWRATDGGYKLVKRN